ncbi:MAG: hypothetical protein NVS4B8_24680 [Herpetosiphon sp.]
MGITASPNWEWYLVGYFFVGGIAAGAYFVAGLIELLGSEADHRIARIAYYLAFPLVLVCTVLLVLDLGRPERFWHMVLQSETLRPMFKYWSPMSYGSWILSVFGALSFVSFMAALAEDGRLGSGLATTAHRVRTGPIGRFIAVLEILAGIGLGYYTGALLSATNVPFWSNSSILGGLFMASAASSGIATLILLARRRTEHDTLERLELLDTIAIGLELVMLLLFVVSLGSLASRLLTNPYGLVMIIGTGVVGLLIPLLIRLRPQAVGRSSVMVSATLVLLGGLLLRYGILFAGQSLTVRAG